MPLTAAARHLHRDPAARLEQPAGGREQRDGFRNVFEHVSQRDRAEPEAGGDKSASVHLVHGRASPARGVSRGSRVELDAFDLPTCLLGQVHESSGVGPDVQQATRAFGRAAVELAKDRPENEVLVIGHELVLDPLLRPALVVHAIEEPRERWKPLGLGESAGVTAHEPERLTAVLVELRILDGVLPVIEPAVMERSKPRAIAHPASGHRVKQGSAARHGRGEGHDGGPDGREYSTLSRESADSRSRGTKPA